MAVNILVWLSMCVLLFTPLLSAEDFNSEGKFKIDISGYTSWDFGQVVKGIRIDRSLDEIRHRWVNNLAIGLFAEAAVNERLQIIVGLEGLLAHSFNVYQNPGGDSYRETQLPRFFLFNGRAEGLYTLEFTEKIQLQVEAGYFPYQVNPEVRNLGEFLFRSMCYPTAKRNYFDRVDTELLGLRIGNGIGRFHHDVILHTEIRDYPMTDFSLSYVADVDLSIVSLGAGIQFYRLFPSDKDATTKIVKFVTPDNEFDSVEVSFAGTKLNSRATIDPVFFLRGKEGFLGDLFGKHGLKIYGELALLGWENYRHFWPERKERMPLMWGFNVPPWKIFDILSFEWEYQNTDEMNSFFDAFYDMVPRANRDEEGQQPHAKTKWSVYMKKSIKRFDIVCQFARDHYIPATYVNTPGLADFTDICLRERKGDKPGDWHWTGKIGFNF